MLEKQENQENHENPENQRNQGNQRNQESLENKEKQDNQGIQGNPENQEIQGNLQYTQGWLPKIYTKFISYVIFLGLSAQRLGRCLQNSARATCSTGTVSIFLHFFQFAWDYTKTIVWRKNSRLFAQICR